MSTQHQVPRLKFARTQPQYGFGRVSEWDTTHNGKDYKLAKHGGQWWLYTCSSSSLQDWDTVPVKDSAGFRCSLGPRLDDAKHNATIFLTLDQGPDHENWRD